MGGEKWNIQSNLRFLDYGKSAPLAYASLYSFSKSFRPSLNLNRNLTLITPVLSNKSLHKILLEAYITTHGNDEYGCCEFLPTRHTFSINNMTYNLTFEEAGTAWGCADKAGEGSEPNEYGTWWYGRGGWCDGMDVKPWVIDVTTAIFDSGGIDMEPYIAEVNYFVEMYSFELDEWIPPVSESASGYVIMSSNLVYYYVDRIGIPGHNENDSTNMTETSLNRTVKHSTTIEEVSVTLVNHFQYVALAIGLICILCLFLSICLCCYSWKRETIYHPVAFPMSQHGIGNSDETEVQL